MALKNYGELKTEIANWLDREDQTANIPGFIKLAESKIYRVLRTRENEFTAQYTKATTPKPFNPIALPQNFREMHLLTLNDRPLRQISSQEYYERKGRQYQGQYTWWTVIGQELYLFPWPDNEQDFDDGEDFTLEFIYYGTESIGEMATWQTPRNPNSVPENDGTPADTTERTDDATTRLLLVAPDALLYGALVEAYKFLREPAKMAEYKALFVETMNDLRMEHAQAEFTGSTAQVSEVYGDGEYGEPNVY